MNDLMFYITADNKSIIFQAYTSSANAEMNASKLVALGPPPSYQYDINEGVKKLWELQHNTRLVIQARGFHEAKLELDH